MTSANWIGRVRRIATVPRLLGLLWIGHSIVGALLVFHVWEKTDRTLLDLRFGFGVLLRNLVESGSYSAVSLIENTDFRFTAHRLPLIPYFLLGLWQLSESLLVAYIAKALIFGALLFRGIYWVFQVTRSAVRTFALVAFVLSFPQLLIRNFDLQTEEGYLIGIMAFLMAALLRAGSLESRLRDDLLFAIVNGSLVLMKSSTWPLALVNCATFALITRRLRSGALSLAVVVLALTTWGLMNLAHSGRFTMNSSWNGYNLYKGNNERVLELYPAYTLDILSVDDFAAPEQLIEDEWEFNSYLSEKAYRYVRENPGPALAATAVKFGQVFLDVRPNGRKPGTPRIDGALRWVGVAYMMVFRLILWSSLAVALRLLWGAARSRELTQRAAVAAAFLGFWGAYAAPYLVGFAYERHILPLVIPTTMFAVSLVWPTTAESPRAG